MVVLETERIDFLVILYSLQTVVIVNQYSF